MAKRAAAAKKTTSQPDLLSVDRRLDAAFGPILPLPKDVIAKAAPTPEPEPKTKPEPKPKGQHVAVVNQTPPPQSMLQVIANAVADPRCDVTKMQALLDMQKQIEERDALKAFTADFIALQASLPAIRMDGKIEIKAKDAKGERTGRVQQATPYATFNNIMKTVKPLLEKHRFVLSFETLPSEDGSRIVVRGILAHAAGHQRTTAFPLPAETSGSKNNVQGWGSSMSYGKRYCTIALLNIVSEAAEDRDRDGNAPPPVKGKSPTPAIPDEMDTIEGEVVTTIDQKQADALVDAIEAAGKTRKDFCAAYKIEKVADLDASLFDHAMAAVRKLARK